MLECYQRAKQGEAKFSDKEMYMWAKYMEVLYDGGQE